METEKEFRVFHSVAELPESDKFVYKNDIEIGHSQSIADITYDILIKYDIPVWLTISRSTILGGFIAWDMKYRNILFKPVVGDRTGTLFLGPKNNYHWQVVDEYDDLFRKMLQPFVDSSRKKAIRDAGSQL